MSAEEQIRLLARIGEANHEHSGPDYLVVPFTLFNLPQKDRGYMSDLMPPAVIRDLIPTAWKEKWQPMSPFLLGLIPAVPPPEAIRPVSTPLIFISSPDSGKFLSPAWLETGSGPRGADQAGSGRSTRSPNPARYLKKALSADISQHRPSQSRSGAVLMVASKTPLPAGPPSTDGDLRGNIPRRLERRSRRWEKNRIFSVRYNGRLENGKEHCSERD